MAQFLRVCKPEICCVARSYGTQRYQQNHYETLNVSPDASQKDIRQAFIRLSKRLHPDTSGKQDHADFVKLNEAYTILGKESARRQYDFELKYCRYNPSYTYHSQSTCILRIFAFAFPDLCLLLHVHVEAKNLMQLMQLPYCCRQYGSQWEYEVRTAGGPWPPSQQKPNAFFGLLIALVFCGLGLLQLIFMFYTIKVRKIVTLRNARIENEYQQIRNSAHTRTNQFVIKNINSAEDLNEYLTKDGNEC
ncbi:DnaJ-like protein 60 [Temnothorax longispinosus]|uniref:DnaJ-like protein 60 n=1 Tax=Temnothorax longispinosus TaxID=300112 RepID=A0A4V3S7N7_9HYME|nr:DnaJ-like protein 60 [Temnothorax longispinosus]